MAISRLFRESASLRKVLSAPDFTHFALSLLVNAPQILNTRKLQSVDEAMARNIDVRYRGHQVCFPLREIDQMLRGVDNPTFGSVRELCARDCYFQAFRFRRPIGTFLDLGANRGMVTVLALLCIGADRAIGVESQQKYEPILELLLRANNVAPSRAPRYTRFITSRSVEASDPSRFISIETIRRQQGVDRFGLVKIDIEGGEIDLFREPEWLAYADNVVMEVHPKAGDLSHIPTALNRYGFTFVSVNTSGERCNINESDFVYASVDGSLSMT